MNLKIWLVCALYMGMWITSCEHHQQGPSEYTQLTHAVEIGSFSVKQLDSLAKSLPDAGHAKWCDTSLNNLMLALGYQFMSLMDYANAYSLFQEAHQQSIGCHTPEQQGKAMFYLARLFRSSFDNEQAYAYLRQVMEIEALLLHYDFYPLVYTELATLEYKNYNYQKAAQICLNALSKFQRATPFVKIEWHNILGLVERAAGNQGEAIYQFKKAIHYAEKYGNAQFGYLYGNLAISMQAANYPLDSVLTYLQYDLNMSLREKQHESAYRVALKMAELKLANLAKPQELLPLLAMADSLNAYLPARMSMENDMDIRMNIISGLPLAYQTAYTKRMMLTNKNNLERLRESNLRLIQSIQSLTNRIASSRNEQMLAQKQKKANTYLTALFAAIALSTSTFAIMLYKRRKLSYELEKSITISAIQQQEINKLKGLSRMLVEAENRVQTAESQHRALTKLMTRFLGYQKAETTTLTFTSASATGTSDSPENTPMPEGEALRAHLLQHFPTLTEQEIKYCICIWANMHSSEIAAARHISLSGVNKSRNRIRKKLALHAEQDLKAWLQSRVPPQTTG